MRRRVILRVFRPEDSVGSIRREALESDSGAVHELWPLGDKRHLHERLDAGVGDDGGGDLGDGGDCGERA